LPERIVNFPIRTHRLTPLPKFLGIAMALVSLTLLADLRGDEPASHPVPYPAGYREWVHVKTGELGPGFPMEAERGLHHVYANKTALAGFENGSFEDGSVLVYDLISVSEKDGVGTEGARRRIE